MPIFETFKSLVCVLMPRGAFMERNRMIGGAVLLFLGVVFLLMNFGILSYELWKLWPAILIIIGAGLLMKDEKKK